jgi:ketosteroid isomerase-like protein
MLNALAAAIVCLTGSDPVAVAVREARDSFNRAIAQRDHEAIAGILDEDVILVTGTDSDLISGRAAQVEIWREDFKDDARLVYVRTPDCVSLSPILPIALETGAWRGAPQSGGDDHLGGGYVAKWRLVDDRWILEAEIFATMDCGGGLCPKPENAAP